MMNSDRVCLFLIGLILGVIFMQLFDMQKKQKRQIAELQEVVQRMAHYLGKADIPENGGKEYKPNLLTDKVLRPWLFAADTTDMNTWWREGENTFSMNAMNAKKGVPCQKETRHE